MAGYILGLDLGPNSIGWAMLESDPETGEPIGFADTDWAKHPPMGARVFEAGLDNFDTAKEQSLNQTRRVARSMRRNHARRNARRRQMKGELVSAGLLPEDKDELAHLMQMDPYQLRAKALIAGLEPHEIGRALYHLCQRRGFKSNRKSGKAKEDEGILQEIGILEKEIKNAGCQTLGEYLYKMTESQNEPFRHSIRKRHTRRDMYESEFQAIIARQQVAQPLLLTGQIVDKLYKTIFFQHPFELTEERRLQAPSRANLHRAPSIRPCPLEPDEKCCPKGEWLAQQFRILKEVANLRISEHFGPERELTEKERKTVLDLLMLKERQKFDDLRKALGKIGTDVEAHFNLERGERKSLLGNSVEYKLSSSFRAATWKKINEQTKVTLRNLLLHAEDPQELVDSLVSAGLDQERAGKLAKWAPADGYIGFSLKAIQQLLPLMKQGLGEYEAIQQAYPNLPVAKKMDRLPPLSSPGLPHELGDITNPVVRRALVELRKVVNAIIREHGLPDRIVVEMAREMKNGPKARKEDNKRKRVREALNEEAAVEVAKFGGNPNYRSDINRWLYWKEQGGICIYTGRSIPTSELFHGGEWEVDHILPHWRSLDDSMMNKVLVHRLANEEKGNRTPFEWLGLDSEQFKQILRRANSQMRNGAGPFPYPKFKRLATREMDPDSFALRQLNDTRYISKLVTQYVSLLYPPELRAGEKAIQTCRGGLTAELRRQWGLNSLLPALYNADGKPVLSEKMDKDGNPLKSRADHRHHAIDAVVIALSNRKTLKRYQDFWKKKESFQGAEKPRFDGPWPEFRADVYDQASRINVSHRVMKKLAGSLHEETFYGPARDRKGNFIPDHYVTRKPLENLTGKMVKSIRDDVVRKIISNRLVALGWNGKDNKLPKDWHQEPLAMPSGVPITKVRIEVPIKNAAQLKHRFAVLGNNHHMEIIASKKKDEQGNPEKMWATVVPTMEAVERAHRHHAPIVKHDHGPDKEFVMSLARKESVLVTNPVTGERVICVVQKMSGLPKYSHGFNIYLRDARDSRKATEGNRSPFKILVSFKAIATLQLKKIQVDPLGRYHPEND